MSQQHGGAGGHRGQAGRGAAAAVGPKPIGPPCPVTKLLAALDQESTAAALRHRRQGQAAHLRHFVAFPFYILREYLAQRPLQLGLVGVVHAWLRAFGTFITWAKVWESHHCATPQCWESRQAAAGARRHVRGAAPQTPPSQAGKTG